MSFASIVPLIGGETIAMQNVSGKKTRIHIELFGV